MKNVSPYAKALAAFVGAALVAYLGAQDGGVTSQEWLQILLAGLGASGLIYVVPNKDPKGLKQQESVQPPERGAVDALFLVAVAVLVVVVLLFFGFHGHH